MRRKLPLLLGATFLAFSAMACEGPTGPRGPQGEPGAAGAPGAPGAPGEPGMDALNTCSDCHSSDATIVAIEQQFATSPHGFGNFEVRGGSSCEGCHTHNGFVAAATGEDINLDGGIASMNCRTCHQVHVDVDEDGLIEADEGFALTTTEPVTIILTENTVDFSNGVEELGAGNLCASCHQARIRSPWPTQITDMSQELTFTSSHYGPHHGPQGNVFAAEIGFEFGDAVEDGFFSAHLPSNDVTCTTCHMESDAVTPAPGGEGGHTYQPAPETCNGCHTGPDVDDEFDYRGTPTTVYNNLMAAGECLENVGIIEIAHEEPALLMADGAVIDDMAELHGGAVVDYHPVPGTYPEPTVAAFLVWASLTEDGSWGVHHPSYARDQAAGVLDFLRTEYPVECPTPVL